MNKLLTAIAIIIRSAITGFELIAQKVIVVTRSIEEIDNKLVIKYDILKAKASQTFNVSIEITGDLGNIISAYSFSGVGSFLFITFSL